MTRGTRFLLSWALVASLSTVVATIALPSQAQDITTGLIGHWKLKETSGTTATDSASTPHHGTYTNAVALASSIPVPVDGALAANFDGVDDYVGIPSESSFDLVGAMTVAAWIKVDVFDADWQAIVTKGRTAWRLQRKDNTNMVQFRCAGLTTDVISCTTNVNDGKWHHVVGVYTGSQLQIYIDGRLNASVSTLGFISTNKFPVEIARNAEDAGRDFDGAIYDVRIYNRALSAADISYLYTQGGPVGHWKLNEASGTTAADSSLYGSNGTLNGSTNWSARCNGTGVFDFNNSTNYIEITNASHLQPTSALTIAGWIKGDSWGSADNTDAILRKGGGNPNNYSLAISDGRVELLLDGNDSTGFRGNTVLSTGVWYHVAATWDGSTVKIYLNGALDNTPPSRTGTIATDTRPLYIGGRSAGSGTAADVFDGMVQQVYLYNRALSQAEIVRLTGLAGYWKFSEGSGTAAADSSGVGNNATLSGGAGWTTDCAGNNNALVTTGSGGIAQTASAFTPPDEGTVAFWMRSNGSPPALGRIFGNGGDWEGRQITDGTLVFDLCGEGGGNFQTTVPLNEVGRWYHVAATFDAATDTYALYLDGQLHKSGTNSNAMSKQPAAVLSFGTRTGSTEYWAGALRDFRVYSRRLCPSEIAELYGLVGHWKLDETSGTAAADSSGLGHGGTLSGTVSWTTGAVDGAHQFNYIDGNDYVTIVNSATLDNVQENSYSLVAWFKPLSTPPGTGSANDAHYAILAKAGYHTALFYSNSRTFEFSHVLTGNQSIGSGTWPVTYPTGLFYHIAGVIDRPAGTMKIYVDGELKNTTTFTADTAAREYGSEPWRIGIANPFYSTWGWGAHGIIDDVRIYNRTLCPTEIQTLHDLGAGAFGGVKIIKWVEIQ